MPAMPALAHCSSWSPVTPLTPAAPMTLPPTKIGTPPGEAMAPVYTSLTQTVLLLALGLLLALVAGTILARRMVVPIHRLQQGAERLGEGDLSQRIAIRTGDEIEVSLGALDAPDQLTPTYENWIVRRESWLPPFPLKRRYERNRDPTSRYED